MALLSIGPKARLQGIRPELNTACVVLLGVLIPHNVRMQISHGVDGIHKRASIHYNGGAEDFMFLDKIGSVIKRQIFEDWKGNVGQDFDILYEDPDGPNEHFHCEYQPKQAYGVQNVGGLT